MKEETVIVNEIRRIDYNWFYGRCGDEYTTYEVGKNGIIKKVIAGECRVRH